MREIPEWYKAIRQLYEEYNITHDTIIKLIHAQEELKGMPRDQQLEMKIKNYNQYLKIIRCALALKSAIANRPREVPRIPKR